MPAAVSTTAPPKTKPALPISSKRISSAAHAGSTPLIKRSVKLKERFKYEIQNEKR
jgi:hypothetical protein